MSLFAGRKALRAGKQPTPDLYPATPGMSLRPRTFTSLGISILCSLLLSIGASATVRSQPDPGQPTPVSVADASCAPCHRSIYDSYLRTPKANASGLASSGLIPGQFVNSRSGVAYSIGSSPEGAFLAYQQPSVVSGWQPLLYYLGSGNLGRTYLYSIDGYLLESPVAWYSATRTYDMAPGLSSVNAIPSALPMNAHCMRCHMSNVQRPDPAADNLFSGLPFLHGGITCEACHGEAVQHIASHGKVALANPSKMAPAARDSVCISCHLEGDTSVELAGKSIFDYTPGQDIREYISFFQDPSNSGRSVTEVEQLSQSVCKRTSGGRMSCLNCHDPHSRPTPEQRVSFYRNKCLACHNAPAFAASHHPENPDCTSCHMPRTEVRDTPHVAWTDHRILKLPAKLSSLTDSSATLTPILPGETVTPRELGIGYYNLLQKGQPRWAGPALSQLEIALHTSPSDVPVMESLAFIYQRMGRIQDAQRLYEEVLKSDPDNVEVNNDLGLLSARQGDLPAAQRLWERAFLHAKDREPVGLNLATVYCLQLETAKAQQVLKTVLTFSPGSEKARTKLQSIDVHGCPAQ